MVPPLTRGPMTCKHNGTYEWLIRWVVIRRWSRSVARVFVPIRDHFVTSQPISTTSRRSQDRQNPRYTGVS
jgi:hypothetical protein